MRRILLFFIALLLAACVEQRVPPVHEAKELVVLTRGGPTTYVAAPPQGAGEGGATAGAATGFEHDLVRLFAESLGLRVRFVVAGSDAEVIRRLKENGGHFAAAWLTPVDDPALLATTPYFVSGNVLVTHEATLPIAEIDQLAGRRVHVLGGSQQASALREVRSRVPTLQTVEEWKQGELDLLEGVAAQRYDAALVDQAVFDIAGNYYPELQGTLEIGRALPVAWLFPATGDPTLLDRANAFMERIREDGTLVRLKDRYFGHIRRLKNLDVVRFIERMRTLLPQYRAMFHEAQTRTGIDWRLLAALAYQESQWNPLATSPTGVRGMMMLTEDTADRLGVSNRLDARQSILAGARYLADLRDGLPAGVPEPDRTWLALAAYNLGMGHLNGGRAIAGSLKANPDSWFEMKRVLPLLARPQYYARLKSGKARGGEAVILVENIRIFADILRRHEAPYRGLEGGEAGGGGR